MKKFLKILFSIILLIILLGLTFFMVDTLRVQSGENPIFTFGHKLVDGIDYSAKIDLGLGYKIIRYDIIGQDEIINIGSIFMDETPPNYGKDMELSDNVLEVSGEIVKITTFGEKYQDTILLEGIEEEVSAKDINSKVGYSMKYYYDLFEYAGFEDHDSYLWYLSSGDDKATLTIYDISNEEAYKEMLENIENEKIFELVSGESVQNSKKLYCRRFEQNEVKMINYIYIIEFGDYKLMVDLYLKEEADEGIGSYMRKMIETIKYTPS